MVLAGREADGGVGTYGDSSREGESVSGEAGQVIAGKYRLDEVLGQGAMGTVWSATHVSLGQRCAVKLIAPEYATSREARQRFKVEATAAARIRSRFVVNVSDTGETDEGVPYLVMELLEGDTVERRLRRDGPLPLGEAVRVTAQVARGLAKAHALGIIHRDLKPANIFLALTDEGAIAKVLDFGIAKITDHNQRTSTTRTGTVLGTPQFMSPEQVRGLRTLDHRADLYSLGMVAYDMLTGRLAFDGDAFGDLLLAICTRPLPSVTGVAPHLPPALDAWFARACAREPQDRFQSADELAAAMAEAAGVELEPALVEVGPPTLGPSGSPRPPAQRAAEDDLPTMREDAPEAARRPGGTIGISSVVTLGPERKTLRQRRIRLALAAATALGTGALLLAAGATSSRSGDAARAKAPAASSPTSAALALRRLHEAAAANRTATPASASALPASATPSAAAATAPVGSAGARARGRPGRGVGKPAARRAARPGEPDLGF
jgi:serine/threonine-protein kinase